MNIKYTLNNIKRNKFQSILTILLISIALASIYIVLFLSNSLKIEYNYVENYFNGGNVFRITTNWDYYKVRIDETDKDIYRKIYKALDEIHNVDLIHYERVASNFDPSNSKLKSLDNYSEFTGNSNIYIEGMGITEATIEHYDLDVIDGRMFNEEPTESGIINIVAGNDFKESFSVGDMLISLNGEKFKITGFLKENEYLPINIGSNVDLKNKKYNLNKSFICDFKEFIGDNFSYYLPISASYIHMNKDASENEKLEIKQKIKDEFNKYNLVVNVRDESKGIFLMLSEIKKQSQIFNITAITIMIFISFSIIITILNSLEKRKKEFGVYILAGATLRDISKIILYELAILNLIAFIILVIAVVVTKIVSVKFLIYIFILTMIYSILTFLIPLIKIRKISIKNLIKGDE